MNSGDTAWILMSTGLVMALRSDERAAPPGWETVRAAFWLVEPVAAQ